MTDANLTEKLPSKPIDFVERNDQRAFLALLRDWMAIFLIVAFSIWINNIFVYLVSVWAIGIFQFAIGEALLHEATHNNLFQNKLWNEQLEFLYGFPVLRTISSYRKHHFPHHKGLGSEEDYIPEYYEMLGLYKEDKNLFWLWFVKPVIGFAIYHFLIDAYIHLKNLDWRPFKSGFKVSLFWLVVVIGFYLSGHIDILLLYWVVPLVWCFPCYVYWSEVHDHFHTVSGTRSNLNFLANLLTHNNGYHYVHHLYPTIPWYKLPEAHETLCPENVDISNGLFDVYRKLSRLTA
ncbi:fatty acid desaturase [Hassallia byssoidea VB512170]|uniref:Fatty acid desaturase n=1 Tax=Hassallia byssoidea VB512170 TaxID=1304833 RepID=A0A846HCW8_9CYAN|nr:fatty acid desaturase [Hassalia byssoidea]NEU75387.1 fatty acid desaturase [Hassalia byssoidea VB512170]